MAKETIKVKYDARNYPFALKCDDIKGIITIHKNSESNITKITTRSVPITLNEKWKFYKDRDGWNGKASYIKISNTTYAFWEKLMIDRYKFLKNNFKINQPIYLVGLFFEKI